jgi:hypothetical protein
MCFRFKEISPKHFGPHCVQIEYKKIHCTRNIKIRNICLSATWKWTENLCFFQRRTFYFPFF